MAGVMRAVKSIGPPRENRAWHALASLIVGAWCLITVVLLLNVLALSFKPSFEILSHPWSISRKIDPVNYAKLLREGFMGYYLNSIIVLFFSVLFVLLLAMPAAYGLGKFTFRGNRLLRIYFLVGMMFPAQLGIIPLFSLMRNLHLLDTLWAVILVYSVSVSVPVYFLTSFIQGIPDALREAARIDGANELRIFLQIFLPMTRPALAALLPLSAVSIWNEFFIPLVLISSDRLKTLPLGLMKYFNGKGFDLSKIGVEFAAMAISIFPLLLLYLIGSRNIVGGLSKGALK